MVALLSISKKTCCQDFKNKNLWFAGTEFGISFTIDGGKNWVQLKSGIPTIAVRDIAIQERESDLVLATFGRGFYILDDYSPLRELSHELAAKDAHIFKIKDALMYVQTGGRSNHGSTYFTAPNPPFGATFTYYLKKVTKTKKQLRKEEEKKLFKAGKPIPQPSWRELQLEGKAEKSHLIFTIYDASDNVVRRLTASPSKGVQRITWNLRYSTPPSVQINGSFDPLSSDKGPGILVMPGTYKVGLQLWHEGELKNLADPVPFICKKLNNTTLPAENYAENVAFAKKVSNLAIAVVGSGRLIGELTSKVESMKQAIYSTPGASQNLMNKARALGKELEELNFKMNGLPAKVSGEEIPPQHVPLNDRLGSITYSHMGSTSGITTTEKQWYKILKEEFPPVLEALKRIVEKDIPAIETELNKLHAPGHRAGYRFGKSNSNKEKKEAWQNQASFFNIENNQVKQVKTAPAKGENLLTRITTFLLFAIVFLLSTPEKTTLYERSIRSSRSRTVKFFPYRPACTKHYHCIYYVWCSLRY
ncbi:MAG: hypothetical protein J7L95_03320 [Prolixibacteraceae bacterium]|nr:hypothetical protein [Prolixibacteraceae bacterium]